jgi:uncharacterized protein (UPF0548 family)
MLCSAKPSEETINTFICAQQRENFSYPEVGSSRHAAPERFTVDHNRIKLGEGADTFERAKSAIRQWKMFEMPWIQLCLPHTSIKPGSTVAVLVSHFGFWSMNACRIVYVRENHGLPERYGFAYGTLPDHAERGKNASRLNSIPMIKQFGMTFTHSRGLAC